MLIAFELSMPRAASWDGRWSGEGREYVRVRSLSKELAQKALVSDEYFYQWEDGWCACIAVRKVDSREAAKLRKRSVGFYGYDWMIDSIIKNGCIERHQEAGEEQS